MREAGKLHAALLKSGLRNRRNLLLLAYARCGALSDARAALGLMPAPNLVSQNTLLSGYVRSHRLDRALDLFDSMPYHDSFSWNTLISGLARAYRWREAVDCFVLMARSCCMPDGFTYSSILPCMDLDTGRQMHARVVKSCPTSDVFVGTNLVRMYGEAGEMEDASKLFDGMPERDLVSWNVMVSCCARYGMGELSVRVFQQMVRDGLRVDEFTFATVLHELAERLLAFEGMQLHSLIVRCGIGSDRFTCNALLNLYSRSGFIHSAAKLFDEMREPDVVSWTALIMGLATSGYESRASEAFRLMRVSGVEPNSFSFGVLIGSCASTSALEKGKQHHALAVKYGIERDVFVGTAAVEMYSKCGEMNDALRLFQTLPERDLVSWNGMICGLAQNGESIKALELFHEMVRSGPTTVTPNHVTFVGVLTACSHGGLVREGCAIFDKMVHEYLIGPQAEHYACVVDILARAGLLEEAESLILASPFDSDVVMWGALLGACKREGNLVMAKRVAERLFVHEPRNSSNYVLLANMHGANGEWNDASKVREVMCMNKAHKMRGTSWIEIRGVVHSFSAGDTDHQLTLTYEVLKRLWLLMRDEICDCGFTH